jgi:hypothetical protein
MKIALCTTTIHVPHALKLMRKCSPDVRFFVAMDKNTPKEAFDFCGKLENTRHYFYGDGDWKCSEIIGMGTLARRNIAFLEALKWGADVIYSWDNDNLPTDNNHFLMIGKVLSWAAYRPPQNGYYTQFNGIKVTGLHDAWFDPGKLLIPATRHRGIPRNKVDVGCEALPVTDAKIGVAAGLVIGDPDIDATTRMELRPYVGGVHLLGQVGIVVDPHTWTVFNSQNTAVIRELIPAWFMMPGVGRHDDIYASLIVQRVARERDYHVHFGPPITYQERNKHDLMKDMRAEIDGMENTWKLAQLLDSILLPARSVIEDTRIIYETLAGCEFIPEQAVKAALAWLVDCEGVI